MPAQYTGLSLTALAIGWASTVQSFALTHSHLASTHQLRSVVTSRSYAQKERAMATSVAQLKVSPDTVAQEWDADLYQQNHNFVWKYGASLLDLVDIQPGDHVLDIGCGTGELTEQLYRCNEQACVTGMDADATMVQRAKEQFEGVDKKLHFFVGDACSFQLDKPVNVVFSNAALHWVGKQGAPRAIACMSRALADNGHFVVEFGGKGNIDTIIKAIRKVMELPQSSADFWWYPSVAEVCGLMEQNGLEVTQAWLFDRPTELTGEGGLKTWLKMFANKFFEGRADAEVERIIERVVEECRLNLYQDGIWRADYRRIRVVGRKLEKAIK